MQPWAMGSRLPDEMEKPPCNARRQAIELQTILSSARRCRIFRHTLLLLASQGLAQLDSQFTQPLGHGLGGDRVYETPCGSLQTGEVVVLQGLFAAWVIGRGMVRTHGNHSIGGLSENHITRRSAKAGISDKIVSVIFVHTF